MSHKISEIRKSSWGQAIHEFQQEVSSVWYTLQQYDNSLQGSPGYEAIESDVKAALTALEKVMMKARNIRTI